MRRFVATVSALLLACVAALSMAAPAQAAHIVHLCSDTSVDGNPGQPLVVVNGCSSTWYFNNWGAILQDDWNGSASASLASGSSRTFTLGSVGNGSISDFYGKPGLSITVHDPAVRVITFPPFVGHDWIQQVGVPASGDCNDVPSSVGHWRGAPTGGWSLSWAQWINDGTGGPVCHRELQDRPDGSIVSVG